jgi:tetratricopeptide (TPR) repeat protein
MRCKYCGAELPMESVFCLKCGSKIEIEKISEEKEFEEKSNEQVEVNDESFCEDTETSNNEAVKNIKIPFKKILLFLTISLCLIVGTILSANLYFIPEHKYNNANELFKNTEYQKSIDAFTEIADYKNSKEMIKECKYQIAIGYYEKENYSDAIKSFEEIFDYKDSAENIKECKYQIAIGYYEKEHYLDALKSFEEILDYKDSAEKINQIHYELGKRSFDARLYEDAIKHLSACNNIEDSESILKEAHYEFGMYLYEKGDFDEAAINLRKSENPEAQKLIEECEFLQKFQGVWYINVGLSGDYNSGVFYINFSGRKCTEKRTYYFRSDLNYEYTYDYEIKDNKIIVLREDRTYFYTSYENYTFYFDSDNNLKWVSTDFWIGDKPVEKEMWKTENDSYSAGKRHPSIGMTADEVRNSTWGYPDDINKTVTSYGTTEQWVYGNKYIYFRDGVVTSISY